jgi:uncharacterized protein
MIFIDTGYLIAVLDPTDHLHARAIEWGRTITRRPQFTTIAVIIELFNHFSATYRRPHLSQFLAALSAAPGFNLLPLDADLWDRGLALHRARPDKFWSLTDCISFTVMTERNITQALAYDHHFEQAGFEALLRRDPP